MKNEDIIENFVDGAEAGRTKNVFIEDNVLYSYGYHFPMAMRIKDGYFIVNKDKYSSTTSRHQNILLRKINKDKIIFKTTTELKTCINFKVTSIKELILNKMENEDE